MLAIASEERMPLFPELPTLKELGYPVIDKAWWSIGVPPETPDEIRKQVADAFAKVVNDESVAGDMKKGGFVPMLIPFPESVAFKEEIKKDYTPVGEALAKTKK